MTTPQIQRETIKRVAVVSSPYKPAGQDVARAIVTWLERAGIEAIPDIDGALDLEKEVATDVDLAISVGGDGTMLSTARRLGESQVPTLGVNLGKLGFLAEFYEAEVREWIAGRKELPLNIIPRMRLRCQVWNDGEEHVQLGLNDAVINQGLLTRLISVDMRVDNEHAIQYRADGLIISTPVGSTAYSLSLGGPILTPGLKAFIVTPTAPHALTNRPIVVAGDSTLSFRISSRVEEAAIVLDGHEVIPLQQDSIFEISRAQHDFLLVSTAKRSYYYLLRTKLGWGENPRFRKDKAAEEEDLEPERETV